MFLSMLQTCCTARK